MRVGRLDGRTAVLFNVADTKPSDLRHHTFLNFRVFLKRRVHTDAGF